MMLKNFYVISLYLFCVASCCSGKNGDSIKISIDIEPFLKAGLCEHCITVLASDANPQETVYLKLYGKNSIVKYDVQKQKIVDSVVLPTSITERLLPFFISKEGALYVFAKQSISLYVFYKGKNPEVYSLSSAYNNDTLNIGCLVFSSYVGKNNTVYLNLLRLHNATSAASYFDSVATLPLAGRFKIRDSSIFVQPIPFTPPHPERRKWRLPSSFFLFDVVESENCVYYQNRSIDTIYKYNTKEDKLQKITPFQSRYPIIPRWYNPDSTEIADQLLIQNLAGEILVDANTKKIYRIISVKLPDKDAFLLQILSAKGKVLQEDILDDNAGTLYRLGQDIFLSSRQGNTYELHKIN